MNEKKPQPVNKEAFKMLASEIGLNAAARKLGVPISTAKSWARRGGWKLSKRPGGRPQGTIPATSLHPVADALDETREQLEDTTKTALTQALTNTAREVAQKGPLNVESIAQLKDAIQAAEKLFGWNNKPATLVQNNVTNVVCTEDQRRQLIEQRERLLAGSSTRRASVEGELVQQMPPDTLKADGDTQASPNTPQTPDVSPVTLLEPLGPGDDEPPTWQEEHWH